MAKYLTDAQCRRFHEHGIVYPVRVLSAQQADWYRDQCDRLEAELGGRPRTVEVRQMHLHFPWAYELATESRILDAVEDLLGPNLVIWATELFAKHAHDAAVSIGWHRDGPYMGLDPAQTLTAWIALSPSNAGNGCMRFVPESDRKRDINWQTCHERNGKPAAEARNAPEQENEAVVLEPGEMSLHDVFVLHGSDANQGQTKRVGFAVRFTTPDARPAADFPPAILARGEDRYGYFDFRAPPRADDDQALAQMRRSALRHLDATIRNLQLARR